MTKRTGPTSPLTRDLVARLRKVKAPIWKEVADRLEKSTRSRAEMNLSRLSTHAKKGESIIVPGRVLGSGNINFPVSIAALSFSGSAKQKIAAAGGKAMSIDEMIEKKPKGLRLMV